VSDLPHFKDSVLGRPRLKKDQEVVEVTEFRAKFIGDGFISVIKGSVHGALIIQRKTICRI
jgi:hypothetical protein